MRSFVFRLRVLFAGAALVAAVMGPASAHAAGKLSVVTATTDLAALAQEVGGDRVEVESIARGYQDPHFVEAKPSFLLKLRRQRLIGAKKPRSTRSVKNKRRQSDQRKRRKEKNAKSESTVT